MCEYSVSLIPFMMLIGPFVKNTKRGKITVQGMCSLRLKPLDFKKGTVSSLSTHISIDITTDKENFHAHCEIKTYLTDKQCMKLFNDKITEFEKTGKLLYN